MKRHGCSVLLAPSGRDPRPGLDGGREALVPATPDHSFEGRWAVGFYAGDNVGNRARVESFSVTLDACIWRGVNVLTIISL
ncbi:MAG: hypothetical protein QXD84_05570 [Thermoplasmata archaeon]